MARRRDRRGSAKQARENVVGQGDPNAVPASVKPRRMKSAVMIDAGIAVAFLIAGMALRFWARVENELWLDEAVAVRTAKHSLWSIIEILSREGTPPLYFFLLHGWIGFFGDGELAMRALSAIFGGLLAPSLYYIGSRLFGRTCGLVAAGLSVAWPLSIYYSEQVRMYTLVPLLSAWVIFALWKTLQSETNDKRLPIALVVGSLALLWTHNFGMFFMVGIFSAAVIVGGRVTRTRKMIVPFVAIAVLDLLWLPFVAIVTLRGFSDWIGPLFPGIGAIGQSFALYGAGFDYPNYLQWMGGPLPTARWAVLWMFAAAGCSIFAASRSARHARAFWALVCCSLVTLGLPCLLSIISNPVYLVGRYDVIAFPPAVLAIGVGAQAWMKLARKPRFAAVVVAVFFAGYIGLDAATLHRSYSRDVPISSTRRQVEILNKSAKTGDVIVTTGNLRAALEHYILKARDDLEIISFPASSAERLGMYDWESLLDSPSELAKEAKNLRERLRAGNSAVYVILDVRGREEIQKINAIMLAEFDSGARERKTLLQLEARGNRKPVPLILRYLP